MSKTRKKVGKTVAKLPLPRDRLLQLYERMALIRRFELAAQKVYREGRMPGFIHLYIGEEAVAAGVCAHLHRQDCITSTHRGHGHALAKGLDPRQVFAELCGKAAGSNGGRGGSMHLYSVDQGLYGTSGLVASGIPVAVGLGLSARTRKTSQVAVSFFGDGASNHGAFHESLNFAAIQKAPVVFVCENNLYATQTPLSVATLNTEIATKSATYGIPGVTVDGNDVLAVYDAALHAVERARRGEGPTLIEAKTYRICGHHEGDPSLGVYRTEEEVESWKTHCPIKTFRNRLISWESSIGKDLDQIDQAVEIRIQDATEFALSAPPPDATTAYCHVFAEPINPPMPSAQGVETETRSWLEAVCEAIAGEMRRDPHILYFGEGIGERGGSFAHTKGLWHEFGGERVVDTPISELGFTGAAIGASASGCRTVADMMFSDFMFDAASQIIHQAAKLRYMSNGQISVPLVVRAMCGAIKNAGPHHSGCYHPIWAHQPGLIVVMPSNPADAKGLFTTALRASDPVIFLEHKQLLANKGPVPEGEYLVPFGRAAVVRTGSDLTLVTCGLMVQLCSIAAEQLASQGLSCEVIDLRTIVPLDIETVTSSVARTGRLLTVDEGYPTCGLGAEIGQTVMEYAFDELDAPVGRLHIDPVNSPCSPVLDTATFISVDKIVEAARTTVDGGAIPPRRAAATTSATSSSEVGTVSAATGDLSATPGITSPVTGPEQALMRPSVEGIPLILPHQDLTVKEATLVKWLKNVGESVNEGEPIVEAETEKASFEVESPVFGILVEILVTEGMTVPLGTRIGTIEPRG